MFNEDVFERIKVEDSNGVEIWKASELMELLEYDEWQSFNSVIEKAMDNFNLSTKKAETSLIFNTSSHFIPIAYTIYKNGCAQKETDYYLTRLACFTITIKADNRKPAVRAARQYLFHSIFENDIRVSS